MCDDDDEVEQFEINEEYPLLYIKIYEQPIVELP
jgi:hypothetical protein